MQGKRERNGKAVIDARKDIIFRDADYKEQFRIKDGDSIKITVAHDGEELVRRCRWLDETHMEVGSAGCLHMDEFRNKQAAAGNKYEPVPNLKPKLDILFAEPGQPPRDAQISVNRAVYALRKLLGGPLITQAISNYAVKVWGNVGPGLYDKSDAFAICGLNGENLASLHPYTARQYKREIALRMQVENVAEKKPYIKDLISEGKKKIAENSASAGIGVPHQANSRKRTGEAI